jgi:hypothetical protein
MTTRVDINIDTSGLLDKALLQRLAGRETLVIREQQAKAEKQGIEKRAERRRTQGRDVATGELLPSRGGDTGRFGSGIQRLDEEPAANRRGDKAAGMSIAWFFSRAVKEQPTIFLEAAQKVELDPCTGLNRIYESSYTKRYSINRVYSGDGSAFYEYDEGFDYTSYWTPAEPFEAPTFNDSDGNTVTYQPFLPTRNTLQAYNPAFPGLIRFADGEGSPQRTTHHYAFPVGKDLLLYYFYRKRQTAFQFSTSQGFYICNYGAGEPGFGDNGILLRDRIFTVEAPFEVVSVDEHCLLVGKNFVKQIDTPTAFRDYLNARVESYTMITVDIFSGSTPLTVFQWQINPPEITPSPGYSLWNATRREKFAVTPPLPGSLLSSLGTFGSGYFITTGGGYRSIVGSTDVDYDAIAAKAPTAFNLNDATGFLSGNSWEAIFDNSTELKFGAQLGTKKVKASSVRMAQSGRPQDSLTYIFPEGTTSTVNWVLKPIIGYDWANKRHCVSQLKALGFSDSDLTP